MKTTKIEKVKQRLENGRSITQRQAIKFFHYYRLSDAIYKINKRYIRDGIPKRIETIMIYKNKIQYAKYQLVI